MHDGSAPPHGEVKEAEREWQNATGWTFQEKAYARPGTRHVIERQFERIARALDPGPRAACSNSAAARDT